MTMIVIWYVSFGPFLKYFATFFPLDLFIFEISFVKPKDYLQYNSLFNFSHPMPHTKMQNICLLNIPVDLFVIDSTLFHLLRHRPHQHALVLFSQTNTAFYCLNCILLANFKVYIKVLIQLHKQLFRSIKTILCLSFDLKFVMLAKTSLPIKYLIFFSVQLPPIISILF